MGISEFIEHLPIADKWKAVLIDISLQSGALLLMKHDTNFVTVFLSIFGGFLLVCRFVKIVIDTKKSYHEAMTAKIEHEKKKNEAI